MGTTNPTTGSYDISQLSTSGQTNGPDGLGYYDDSQSNHGNGEPGQTFTTSGYSPGYLLNSVTVKTGGGTTSGTGTPQGYLLHIYSVSNGVATVIATYSASSFTFTDGHWLRWSGFSLPLSPNVTYAYSFGKISSAVSGWEAMGNAGGNRYSGGELGLMPVAGGAISYGGSHNYDAVFDVGLTSTGDPTMAVLTNTPATGVLASSATLNGNVLFTGGDIPQMTIYYGTSDGGTNPEAWDNNIALGLQNGAFAATVSNLTANTTYYFASQASNSTGISWATPSQPFATPPLELAVVINLPPSNVQGNLATLNGAVVSGGNEISTVTLYYGSADGGTNAADWTNSIYLGQQSGNFNVPVTGLSTNTIYYYTAAATNSAGTAWAQPAATFTTPPNPLMLKDMGTNAPTPGPYDIFQLSTFGNSDSPDGLGYYDDSQSNHGLGEPGQTFSTLIYSSGYTLNSIAIKTGGGTTSGTGTPQGYLLHIYSVSNGVATVISTYSATSFSFADGDWLQWSGFSLPLSSNAVYGYSFGKISSAVTSWDAMGNAGGNRYSGGELGLMPVAGGTITFGGSHNYDAVFDIGLASTGDPTVAVLTNTPATGILAESATLNGAVLGTGGSFPQVTIYYGTSDGGTNAAAWETNVILSGTQSGAFSAVVTGLQTNTTYYFAAQASNSTGISWGIPSQSFTTPTVTLPAVTNLPASNVQGNLAILNGAVVSTGGQVPAVTLYYGMTDGGTNAADWTNSIYLGQQGGNFAITVPGLSTNTTYYYTTAAENGAGIAWAQSSASFTTLPTVFTVSVLTEHYDNARTGANTNETLLTPGTVNTNNFGLLIKYPTDAYVYTEPLYVPNVMIPGQGTHNAVYVATEHNSVYAFDADGIVGTNGGILWHTNLGISALGNNGEFGTRYGGNVYPDVGPEVGVTGTPVIDPDTGTVYLDVFTREVVAGVSTNYYHRIHALNITNGMEQPYSPVTVNASVPGTGRDSSGGVVAFNAKQSNARPALTLAGGVLYVAYASYGDTDPYHGWVMGFNATNLAPLTNYVFCTTPNATTNVFGVNAAEGGIWMGGNGLCVDANNNLYFQTGNGSFSANTNGGDYGDSMMKLSTSNSLAVADYFTPYNQLTLANNDTDLGSCGAVLLPDPVGSTNHPHLIVSTGKSGTMYLVDRDNMGHYHGTDGVNGNDSQIVQSFGATASTWSSPAYFNNQIYLQPSGAAMRSFAISSGHVSTTTSAATTATASVGVDNGGPVISANGVNNGIVWVVDGAGSTGTEVLYAYNATNLSQQLYNSSQLSRDVPGNGVKLITPTVANGKVYVGAQFALAIYGYTSFLATPVIAPAGGNYANFVTVTLSDATPGAAIYYTLDGTVPTTNSLPYIAPIVITNTLSLQAIAVKAGAVNSGVASASFVNTAALGNGVGLLGQYWTNTAGVDFTNISFNTVATLVRTDAVVDFDWSSAGSDPVIGQTNYVVRWSGSVQPQYDEAYTFTTIAGGGVRLWVNGQLLVDDWNEHSSAATNTGTISLKSQQFYNIQMDYFQADESNAVAQLQWSSPSTPLQVIPQTQLYPYTNPPPTVVISSPADGSAYTADASVTVGADADAPYNPVSKVDFYANGSLIGAVSNSPDAPSYELTTTGLAAGGYTLTAVATDGSGLGSTSAPVNITVNPGSGTPYGLTTNAPVNAFLNMPTASTGTLPPLLSETGAFSDTANRITSAGLIPYVPNTILWSDNAIKNRYMALPSSGGTITPDEQIGFRPTNSWTFPAGAVFVKNFDLAVNETNAGVPLRRLETRLLVRDINGTVYGVTYKWRPDDSDADLLSGSLTEDILITNATGVRTQTWYYPSPADCLTCHTPVAGYVLGVNTRQLNGDETYPAAGGTNTDNQLRTLNRLGLFNPAFDESAITNFEKLSALTNLTASLEERARSYLDANCSQCHQPGGSGITFDARYDTPLAQQNITNYPASFSLGADNAKIVKARDIWRSVLLTRINTNDATIKMPPLARGVIDTNAVQVFAGWINSLPGVPALAPPAIAPDGGSYIASVGVTLSAPDTNASVYYTLDGTPPTTNSFLYSNPFKLTGDTTVEAVAFETNYDNSIAASALFLVQPLNFTSLGFLPDQQFQMGFAGVTGGNYVLEATTNFVDWTPIGTNTAGTNLFNWIDPDATNFQFRFYRVQQQ